MTRLEIFRHNGFQALVCLDQAVLNVGGFLWSAAALVFHCLPVCETWADETLSSRAWRWDKDGVRGWPRKLIDRLFFWEEDHCLASYTSEREGRQLPPELRGIR